MENKSVNESRAQIKRKYGEHSSIRVNEKAPVRNKVIEFVGKRFVTEEEMKTFLTKLTEERGKEMNQKQWFDRNRRFFESFENRGQRVWTLSKYGQRVLELVKRSTQKQSINESIGLFKSEIFESVRMEEYLNEGALAKKGAKEFYDFNLADQMKHQNEKEWIDYYQAIADALGADPKDVIQIDSEGHDVDPLSTKIYNYLQTHCTAREEFPLPKGFQNTQHGTFTYIDTKLNVVRMDDYGFVGFFFTKDSKF